MSGAVITFKPVYIWSRTAGAVLDENSRVGARQPLSIGAMPGGSAARFAAALAVLAAVRAGDEDVFRRQINELKGQAVDMFFLIDGSSSVGEANFRLEIGFVKKLLSDFTVSDAATRVWTKVFVLHEREVKRHVTMRSSA